jgi:aryl-alcohol dehydrogenase-like predicted oxidoreductase
MIQKINFGRTGHFCSRILLGAAAFSNVTQDEADSSIALALDAGVNHLDVAAGYGDAELRVGSWIGRHGRPFFLATKTGERTREKAYEQIHRSLERLQVDQVDLMQLHFLVDPTEWEIAMGPGGALEAVIDAQQEGLVRYIGITGHGLTTAAMHLRALERFAFDSVLLPYSYLMSQHAQYESEFRQLEQVCRQKQIAIQTIKSLVHSPWGDIRPNRATWYRPLEDQAAIDAQVHWVLGQEGLFLNTVGDIHLLPAVLDAAKRYASPPSRESMQEVADRMGMRSLFE